MLLLESGASLLPSFSPPTLDKELCLEVIVAVDVASSPGKKLKGSRHGPMNGWETASRLELMLITLGEMDADTVKLLLRDVEEGTEMAGTMVEGTDVSCDVDDGADMEDDNGRSTLGDPKATGHTLVTAHCLHVIALDEATVICLVVFVLTEVKAIIGNLTHGVEMCSLDPTFMTTFLKPTRDPLAELSLGTNGLVTVSVREGGAGLLACNWFNAASARRVTSTLV